MKTNQDFPASVLGRWNDLLSATNSNNVNNVNNNLNQSLPNQLTQHHSHVQQQHHRQQDLQHQHLPQNPWARKTDLTQPPPVSQTGINQSLIQSQDTARYSNSQPMLPSNSGKAEELSNSFVAQGITTPAQSTSQGGLPLVPTNVGAPTRSLVSDLDKLFHTKPITATADHSNSRMAQVPKLISTYTDNIIINTNTVATNQFWCNASFHDQGYASSRRLPGPNQSY